MALESFRDQLEGIVVESIYNVKSERHILIDK